jgi:outer membrane protein W
MRRLVLALAVSLACTTALFAQEKGDLRLHVFLSDLAYSSSQGGPSTTEGGGAIALNYWWLPQLSTQFSVGAEYHRNTVVENTGSSVRYHVQGLHTHPIDAMAQYHFLNHSRWTPYLGLGAHYVAVPHAEFGSFHDRLSGEAGAGVLFRMTPRLSLQLGATSLLRSSSPRYDPLVRPAIGLSWRF